MNIELEKLRLRVMLYARKRVSEELPDETKTAMRNALLNYAERGASRAIDLLQAEDKLKTDSTELLPADVRLRLRSYRK